jgi:hypothetical protein
VNIIQAMKDPGLFGRHFQGESWDPWRTFLKALFALEINEAEREAFNLHCGGRPLPSEPVREAWLVVGRRGGKSLIAALTAVYLATFKDYRPHLAAGERATIMAIAADRRQARVIFRYVSGFLESPMLSGLVEKQTQESIDLTNRVSIEIHTASFRSTRGYTLAACLADECAFWRSEESANPDTEIIGAIRPGLATLPGSVLLGLSSPYARRGLLWKMHHRHFGKPSPILVWQAGTRHMNPAFPQSVIDQALEEDEPAAKAEYLAQFRHDVEDFVSRETLEAATSPGRAVLPPLSELTYRAFVDPSGGSADSFTLAIAHAEKGKQVLDLVAERRPPFSPEAVVLEFAAILKQYRVHSVSGDRYAGEWPREQFRKAGIEYRPAEKTKSELYAALLPLLNSGQVELLDNPRLQAQLLNLERRTSRGGRDSIDHGPGGHDDLANAAAGALVSAKLAPRCQIFF